MKKLISVFLGLCLSASIYAQTILQIGDTVSVILLNIDRVIKGETVYANEVFWLTTKRDINRLITKTDSLQLVIDNLDEQIALHKQKGDTLHKQITLQKQIIEDYKKKEQTYQTQIAGCEKRAETAETVAKTTNSRVQMWKRATLIGIPTGIAVGFIAALFLL